MKKVTVLLLPLLLETSLCGFSIKGHPSEKASFFQAALDYVCSSLKISLRERTYIAYPQLKYDYGDLLSRTEERLWITYDPHEDVSYVARFQVTIRTIDEKITLTYEA